MRSNEVLYKPNCTLLQPNLAISPRHRHGNTLQQISDCPAINPSLGQQVFHG
ncbi:unnamed protein product [Brugia timori]|uniref:Uncharacterized protein n=1 Tax=Brugia timori TaxID=42155 RepID=A0A3P7TSE0_9BILA|nr:unnamed protein product [Brugia timori]